MGNRLRFITIGAITLVASAAWGRSAFRITQARTASRGTVELRLVYTHPGANRRSGAKNTVRLYAHLDGAPRHDDLAIKRVSSPTAPRGSKPVSEGIFLRSLLFSEEQGDCRLLIDLSRPEFASVKAGDEIWVAGAFAANNHVWGTYTGLGNCPISFTVPGDAL